MRPVVAWGMALVASTYGLARFGYGLFLPDFRTTFEIGSTLAGAVSAASFGAYCLAALAATRTVAHPRRTVLAAGGLAAAGSVVVAGSTDVLLLAVGVVVAGSGAGLASPGLVPLVARGVPRRHRSGAQGVVNAGTGAGIAVAGVLVLVTAGHWRTAWLAVATVAVVATAGTLRADRRRPTDDVVVAALVRTSVRALAPLVRPAVGAVLAGASSAAVWTFGPSVLAGGTTGSTGGTGGYVTVAWVVLSVAAVLGATVGPLVGRWGLELAWGLTCSAAAGATVVLGLAPGVPAVALAAVAVFGAGYTALSGVLLLWAVRRTPDAAATGTVVLFVALACGQAAGSAVLGVAMDLASSAVTFGIAGGIGLVGAAVALRGRRRGPRARAGGSVLQQRSITV